MHRRMNSEGHNKNQSVIAGVLGTTAGVANTMFSLLESDAASGPTPMTQNTTASNATDNDTPGATQSVQWILGAEFPSFLELSKDAAKAAEQTGDVGFIGEVPVKEKGSS